MIPTIYEESEKQKYHIMEYIDGITVHDFNYDIAFTKFLTKDFASMNFLVDTNFDISHYINQVDLLFEESIKRGFNPYGLHESNVVLDHRYNVWVVGIDKFESIPKGNHKQDDYKSTEDYKLMIKHGEAIEEMMNNTDNFPPFLQRYIKQRKELLF